MEAIRRRLVPAAIVLVAIVGALYLLTPALKRLVQSQATQALQSEFGSPVQFKSFEVSLFPWIYVVARGVFIGSDHASPLVEATSAEAHCGLLPWHVRTVAVQGLFLHIATRSMPAAARPKPLFPLSIGELIAENAHIEMLPKAEGSTTPLHFEILSMRVENFQAGHAAGFSASIVTTQPRTNINASGRVGPWNTNNPSLTPIDGNYTMPRSNLADLPGLQGTLVSKGRFRGVVGRIELAGDAEVSGFGLSGAGHPEPLRAVYEAALDASDNSLAIEKLDGTLQNSPFLAHGNVRNLQDDRERGISLGLSIKQGRLEDILPLALRSSKSFISGGLRLEAKGEIAPGEQNMLDRLRMNADFAASNARFASLDWREKLRNLSRKASGHPEDAASGSSVSNMQGRVELNGGSAQFTKLVFELEDASARLNGSISMGTYGWLPSYRRPQLE